MFIVRKQLMLASFALSVLTFGGFMGCFALAAWHSFWALLTGRVSVGQATFALLWCGGLYAFLDVVLIVLLAKFGTAYIVASRDEPVVRREESLRRSRWWMIAVGLAVGAFILAVSGFVPMSSNVELGRAMAVSFCIFVIGMLCLVANNIIQALATRPNE